MRAEQSGRGTGPAAGRRWPTYLVTAQHEIVQAPTSPVPRLPYGPWHARRVGSLQTACGLPAVGWRYFWTLDFQRSGGRACPDCALVAGMSPPPTGG